MIRVNNDSAGATIESMSDRLKIAVERARFQSARSAAEAMGVKVSTFAAHHNGQNNFKESSAKLYGKALNVSWLWLLHGRRSPDPDPDPDPDEIQLYSATHLPSGIFRPTPNAIVGDKITAMGKSIPVYGRAVGGVDGEFDMNGSRLYNVMAPPVLSAISGAYAVLVSGDSMEPRYFDRETVFVHPSRWPVRGDFVVAQIQYEEESARLAYIKRFLRRNENELALEQFNPAKELLFPNKNVVSVHYIAMSSSV